MAHQVGGRKCHQHLIIVDHEGQVLHVVGRIGQVVGGDGLAGYQRNHCDPPHGYLEVAYSFERRKLHRHVHQPHIRRLQERANRDVMGRHHHGHGARRYGCSGWQWPCYPIDNHRQESASKGNHEYASQSDHDPSTSRHWCFPPRSFSSGQVQRECSGVELALAAKSYHAAVHEITLDSLVIGSQITFVSVQVI